MTSIPKRYICLPSIQCPASDLAVSSFEDLQPIQQPIRLLQLLSCHHELLAGRLARLGFAPRARPHIIAPRPLAAQLRVDQHLQVLECLVPDTSRPVELRCRQAELARVRIRTRDCRWHGGGVAPEPDADA